MSLGPISSTRNCCCLLATKQNTIKQNETTGSSRFVGQSSDFVLLVRVRSEKCFRFLLRITFHCFLGSFDRVDIMGSGCGV